MTLYNPLALLFLINIPIIIFLYLLKQKFEERSISSLYLWQQVLKDVESKSPWQKLRRNLLMFLQILAVVLLSLILSQPYLNSSISSKKNMLFILDLSMSMKSTDVGGSRIEEAKKEINKIVKNASPKTSFSLVTISDKVELLLNKTKNKSEVNSLLSKLDAENTKIKISDVSNFLSSIMQQDKNTEVAFFTDMDLKFNEKAIKVKRFVGKGDNKSILLISKNKSEKDMNVLTKIANYSNEKASIPISLYCDGKLFDSKSIDINSNDTKDVLWNNIALNTMKIECKLEISDDLKEDNIAYLATNKEEKIKTLLVSNGNTFIEKILKVLGNNEVFRVKPEEVNDIKDKYDLYIFDSVTPIKLPAKSNILWFNPDSNSLFEVGKEIEISKIEKSESRMMNGINDNSFSLLKTKNMKMPSGGELILSSKEAPLAFSFSNNDYRMVVFGFDLHNTDLPLKQSFPVLMTNIADWIFPNRIKNIENTIPKNDINFVLKPNTKSAKIKTSSDDFIEIAPPLPAHYQVSNDLGFSELHELTDKTTNISYFAVNPPSDKEGNIKGQKEKVDTLDSFSVQSSNANNEFNISQILLILLLILLLGEWWVYTNEI